MPKEKNEEKRLLIMGLAKRLFSDPGSQGATLKELARMADMPPSGIYTYFSSKDEIISAIIEDSWGWLGKESRTDGEVGDEERLRLFCGMYLPELLADRNLVSLIVRYPQLIPDPEKKLDALISLLAPGLEIRGERYGSLPVDGQGRKAQAAILFLGCLCAVHFAAHAGLDFSVKDILNAMRAFLNVQPRA
jgi:AcrR family transcriptional regulator